MSIDQKWFNRIKTVNAQLPTKLKITSHFSIKKRFLRDTTKEPIFEFGHLHDKHLKEKKVSLDELALDILHCSLTPSAVKELYIKKIAEKHNQLCLLEVLQKVQSLDQKKELIAEAQELSERIYGAPEADIFAQVINRVRTRLSTDWEHLQTVAAHQRLQHLFPREMKTSIADLKLPPAADSSEIEVVYTDAELVAQRFKESLRQAGLTEWGVKISAQKAGVIGVRPRGRYISIPNSSILSNRSILITEQILKGLLAHEVLVHARRAEHGRSSGLSLLAIGLDKYWRGEEGVATYYEQKIIGAIDYAGFLPYLTIGLAYGLDRGGVPRTFREVFVIVRDYHTLNSYDSGRDSDTLAFLSCMRVFKVDPSFVLTRDCVYRAGNIAVHQLLQQKTLSDEFLNVGKYDPTNEDHVRCLTELGILPAEAV